jgi:TonB-dependent SusC/RagA subfamily outer membrane receptor
MYRDEWLGQASKVTLDVKDATVEQVLELCFRNQPFTYSILDKLVVVKQKPPPAVVLESIEASPPPPLDITGRITNKEGEPLAGANIIIKGTGRGVVADANGKFLLKNVNSTDEIVLSFVGYKKQTIKVGVITNFTLVMEAATNELDKVVVQAYGITSQRFTTGSIVRVTAEDIQKQPVMNPLLALQGKVAGLQVTQTSGYASAPIKLELRGRNALSNTIHSDPLYIIDGVPLSVVALNDGVYLYGSPGFLQNSLGGPAGGQSPLFNINPADIESIEVLKDADATAIYGSRGANGVVLITTKKGKPGKTKFDLSVQEGITHVTRFYKLLNTQQYLAMRHEAFKNDGLTPDPIADFDINGTWDTTRYTDWQKEFYGGMGRALNTVAGLSGGNAQTSFRIGASCSRTTNVLTVSGADQRSTLSLNLQHRTPDQRFKMSLTAGYSFAKSDMINMPSVIGSIAPDAPALYDSAGNLNYAGWGELPVTPPLAMLTVLQT